MASRAIHVGWQNIKYCRSHLCKNACRQTMVHLKNLGRREWQYFRTIDRGRRLFHFSSTCSRSSQRLTDKDEPIAYSKSRAKQHTVNDTLGVRENVSNVPWVLGFGLFTVLFYVGFVRKDSDINWQQIFEMQPQQPEVDRMESLPLETTDRKFQLGEKKSS